jgi:hypothetical protein
MKLEITLALYAFHLPVLSNQRHDVGLLTSLLLSSLELSDTKVYEPYVRGQVTLATRRSLLKKARAVPKPCTLHPGPNPRNRQEYLAYKEHPTQ